MRRVMCWRFTHRRAPSCQHYYQSSAEGQRGVRGEGGEREKRRVRDRGKDPCMHCCSPRLAAGRPTRLEQQSHNRPAVIIHGSARGDGGKKRSFPATKEIVAARLIKVDREGRKVETKDRPGVRQEDGGRDADR